MKLVSKIKILSLLAIFILTGCQKEQSAVQASPAPTSPTPIRPTVVPPKPIVYEGPFGLKMGLSIEEIKKIASLSKINKEQSDLFYRIDAVPMPHPDFAIYSLQFSEKTGLCRILAIGKEIKSGSSGSEIKMNFYHLAESLTKKYGKGKKHDLPSSNYEAPEHWMIHLLKNNRMLSKIWDKKAKQIYQVI